MGALPVGIRSRVCVDSNERTVRQKCFFSGDAMRKRVCFGFRRAPRARFDGRTTDSLSSPLSLESLFRREEHRSPNGRLSGSPAFHAQPPLCHRNPGASCPRRGDPTGVRWRDLEARSRDRTISHGKKNVFHSSCAHSCALCQELREIELARSGGREPPLPVQMIGKAQTLSVGREESFGSGQRH